MERLVPGMQDHRRAELPAQVLLATLEECLTGGTEQQGQQETFVAHDERIEGVRHGKNGGEGGRREQRSAPLFHPLDLRQRLTCGTVAIPARALRLARKAARWTPLRMPPELGCATGDDGVNDLVLGRGDLMSLPGGVAVEAEEVGDFPGWPVRSWLAVPGMGTAHRGRHDLTPWRHWVALQPRPADRTGCGAWPGAAG